MRYLLLVIALLSCSDRVCAQTVTLAWAANIEPDLAGYIVQASSTRGGPYIDIGTVATGVTQEAIPVELGRFYVFVVRAFNRGGLLSEPSKEVEFTTPGDDDCTAITGKYAVSIFPTSLMKTGSGGPGSKARLMYQVASPNAPVRRIELKANGVPLRPPMGGSDADVTDSAGQWFSMPASGTYVLTITATNSQNCTTTVVYRPDLIVP